MIFIYSLIGSYAALIGGHIEEDLTDLAGGLTVSHLLEDVVPVILQQD